MSTDKKREPLSIEEKYDEVRQLISIGKEKGYLLYDEVNELLPTEITSSEELDDLFNTFGSAGIEVIDSDQKYARDEKPIDRTGEGAEEIELDLTPGALDKTNDPVRMYLREMGTVPLLTREGEVEIAKRIEGGEHRVLDAILASPIAVREIIDLGEKLKKGKIRVKELIKYKGFQVAPAELEAILLTHPAVADAAVIPCKDDEAGEVPKAFVVVKSETSAAAIMDFVAARVSPHKKIRAVEFIDQIPKSLSGKILRRVLIEKERNRIQTSG